MENIVDIVFATANEHKAKEVAKMLGPEYNLLTLRDINFTDEIEEYGSTMEENARIKARAVSKMTEVPIISDDSGLEVYSLDMRPGLFSARFAGPQKSAHDNMDKLLTEMQDISDRAAQFRAVMALIIDGVEHVFEGIVKGQILRERHGEGGFGYDPIFLPDGYDKTFAELSQDIKNNISHRYHAIRAMKTHLEVQ